MEMGASTVKWTTLYPCLGSSESDSKVNTYFEFCGEKIHRRSNNILIYKAKQFMMTQKKKKKSKKCLHVLEDSASGVTGGDIEQETV